MDLDYSPNLLDTPSLITPNISNNSMLFKSSYVTNNDDTHQTSINDRNVTDESSSANSSAEVKLSKIEHELKQSFNQSRQPTESPFRKLAESGGSGGLSMAKPASLSLTGDDGIPIEIPSTAEVMNVIESFARNLAKDNNERELTTTTTTVTLISDNHRLDSSPTQAMGVIVSPKKKLLIRSQSHTEPTSPSVAQSSQAQNDEISIDDHRFQRLQDIPLIDSNPQVDLHIKSNYSNQAPIVITTKRTFPQAMTVPLPAGISIPKPLIPAHHEVSSSGQLTSIKRQKTASMMNPTARSSTHDDSPNNDDHRKKQIRESNREAARRCRERRRNYIEQLEGNLEQCKVQIKQLNEKISRSERENTQLRAIIAEAKIFHSSTRHPSSNDSSMIDFVNGMDISNETTDGNALPRNFIQRNTR